MKTGKPVTPARTVVYAIGLGIVMSLALSAVAGAADLKDSYRGRAGRYEVTLQPRYLDSKDVGFSGGSNIELDDDLGFGFGFGYNFTNKLALHLDWSWASMNYRANIASTDAGGNPTGTQTASGTLDTSTVAVNMTYYFLDGPVTPFVMGGIGWTFVDSNIPSGPPEGFCWWDPWYGYVCTSYQNTFTDDSISYNLGVGARWDMTPGFFLRGSVGWQWVDFDRAGTEAFVGGRLDIGFIF